MSKRFFCKLGKQNKTNYVNKILQKENLKDPCVKINKSYHLNKMVDVVRK